MKADLRNKKLSSNVIESENDSVLKSACIYGSNNSGKTCLVRIIRAIWSIILNKTGSISPNLYSNDTNIFISCRFIQDEKEWEFSFKYNIVTGNFVYECFSLIEIDEYKNKKKNIYYERDFENNKFYSKDEVLKDSLTLMSKNNILIHIVETEKLEYLTIAKTILQKFASRIVIFDMNNISMDQTIELLKTHSEIQKDIVSFVKNADLDLDEIKYIDTAQIKEVKTSNQAPSEDVIAMKIKKSVEDSLRLVSVYKGIPVPSFQYDSTGTKKITALASYVIMALKQGHILVVDELDSSIHFKLTRAIVSMFNNELNNSAQLIFTAHDVSLMDCKKLFRKEQIWFVHKDEKQVYLYPLSSFTAEDGIRGDTTDLFEKYKKGILGAIPEPDMLKTLIQVKNE